MSTENEHNLEGSRPAPEGSVPYASDHPLARGGDTSASVPEAKATPALLETPPESPKIAPESIPAALPPHPEPIEISAPASPPLIPQLAEHEESGGLITERSSLKSILIGLVFMGFGLGSLFVIVESLGTQVPTGNEGHVAAVEQVYDFNAYSGISLIGKSAYVLDTTNGRVLYELNASQQLPLASITKVALALAVAEVLDPGETVTISREAVAEGGGGLTWGEMWQVSDLIDFTLIASSNTGAEALAEAADSDLLLKYPDAPQTRAAIWRMNNIAQSLGLEETYFLNPSGLDESLTQAGAMGSARNVAKLFSYAIQNKRDLFASTAQPRMHLSALNISGREVDNTNNALDAIPNLIMGKTGYTDLAGGNLAIVFEPRPNHPVVIVVLGSTLNGRFEDIKTLVQATEKAISPRD